MGVLPLEFLPGESVDSLGLDGTETYSISDFEVSTSSPRTVTVTAEHPRTAAHTTFSVIVRIDTAREEEYYRSGGLLPHVLDGILTRAYHQHNKTAR